MNATFLSLRRDIPPPYCVVIFSSRRTEVDDGFSVLDGRLYEKARTPGGFLGMNTLRMPNGRGGAPVYWKTRENTEARRMDQDHARAKERGRSARYSDFGVETCRVEAAYGKDREIPNRLFSYSSVCG